MAGEISSPKKVHRRTKQRAASGAEHDFQRQAQAIAAARRAYLRSVLLFRATFVTMTLMLLGSASVAFA